MNHLGNIHELVLSHRLAWREAFICFSDVAGDKVIPYCDLHPVRFTHRKIFQ